MQQQKTVSPLEKELKLILDKIKLELLLKPNEITLHDGREILRTAHEVAWFISFTGKVTS